MQGTPLKRKIITLERIVKTGMVNFVRNISLSVAATAVMVVTLTIVLFSVIANATLNNTINDINNRIDVSVYLKDTVTPDQLDAFTNQLKQLENVDSVKYIDKSQAQQSYQQNNQNDVDLQIAISQVDNPIPATLQIKPKDPARIDEIRSIIETPDNKALQVADSSYSGQRKEALDNITRATAFFTKAVFIGVIAFATISMLIIFNTIQMAIFNRRDELTIMRLLGASPWYIRGPFIVETVLYGIVSAVISVSLCYSLFVVQAHTFDATNFGILNLQFAEKYFSDHFFVFLGMQLAVGIAIGAISAYIATRRYLKLKPATGRRRFKKK